MSVDSNLKRCIETIFETLDKAGPASAYRERGSLSKELERTFDKFIRGSTTTTVTVKPWIASMFATAAVEVWMRGIDSFLTSAFLTDISPIWASVCGYYSSHYSVRALAHLLGYFQLFQKKQIVQLEINHGKFLCSFDPKQRSEREHRFYWQKVKQHPYFNTDPLFTTNDSGQEVSDVRHRNLANYADHVFQLFNFRAVDLETLKRRVDFISQITFDAPPIPSLDRFPDIRSVQVVAYHRLVKFRLFLDSILGEGNRFWKVHRNPSWAREIMHFRLTEQGGLVSLGDRI